VSIVLVFGNFLFLPKRLFSIIISQFIMSYSPSSQPNVTKPDWLSRIENMKVNRKDMNKLIMNYLVSGMYNYE